MSEPKVLAEWGPDGARHRLWLDDSGDVVLDYESGGVWYPALPNDWPRALRALAFALSRGDVVLLSRPRTLCVECGPDVPVDEDECCQLCGRDAMGDWLAKLGGGEG